MADAREIDPAIQSRGDGFRRPAVGLWFARLAVGISPPARAEEGQV